MKDLEWILCMWIAFLVFVAFMAYLVLMLIG